MSESVQERLARATVEAEAGYYRLVILVGASGSGKTGVLREVAERLICPVVNLNLTLCQRLLELTRKQRALRVRAILADELDRFEARVVMLDNIEVLFTPELAQDPLKLLQSLSRNQTIVATWPGRFEKTHLTYAEPGHPEWRKYVGPEATIVVMEGSRPAMARSSGEQNEAKGLERT